ncbi:GLABROUS1 enhancer-binding protein family protein [Dioscorea alata]|uniref:GLABROUS1 enhancer-binding protein family protein n=1 Tax=Dioscorea alata TaxID=55571 RepID=A0ACB7U5Q2_DIOAL|nr:GLABROUS1 enhancer-binding protein family protein [Dioscorea alata]
MPTKRLTSPPSRKRPDISNTKRSPNPKKPKSSESNAMQPRKSSRSRPATPGKLSDFATSTSRSAPKKWTDADEIALLKAVLAFRDKTGAVPAAQTIHSFYDSIKDSVSAPLDPSQAYNKIRRLKAFHLNNHRSGPTPHNAVIYELCSEIWGVNEKMGDGDDGDDDDDADEDGDDDDNDEEKKEKDDEDVDYPHLSAFVALHRKEHLHLSGEFLNEGLKMIDPEKTKELELRLMEHCRSVARIQMRRFELCKEVLKMLMGP